MGSARAIRLGMAFPHAAAAILSVGDELTLGQTLDTNSKWLSERLLSFGVVVREHVTIADDRAAQAAAFARLAGAYDLVICTGGLGPTPDDITREALSDALASPLVEDAIALAQVEAYFQARGREMPAINRVQAMRPVSAMSLHNLHGTAPGVCATIRSSTRACDVFCLPGPPREMQPMFESQVAPRLRPPSGRVVVTRVLHTVGIGESDLATRLGAMMERGRMPLVGTTASGGIVSMRIRYEGESARDEAEDAVTRTAGEARTLAGPHCFGEGDATLASAIVHTLKDRGESVAFAESCTGGKLAGMLTEVPGASSVFGHGWVTYANRAKQRELGVLASVFAPDGPGAVSSECAMQMALGGRERAKSTYALAVTGIAGPDGGTREKPVGTVWIALAHEGGVEARRFLIAGERGNVRAWSCMAALAMLWLRLAGAPEVVLLRELERVQR